jgi:hypothetical protein
MPDINHVIRRDQNRTFTAEYLRPMRGSCRQFMIFGRPGGLTEVLLRSADVWLHLQGFPILSIPAFSN